MAAKYKYHILWGSWGVTFLLRQHLWSRGVWRSTNFVDSLQIGWLLSKTFESSGFSVGHSSSCRPARNLNSFDSARFQYTTRVRRVSGWLLASICKWLWLGNLCVAPYYSIVWWLKEAQFHFHCCDSWNICCQTILLQSPSRRHISKRSFLQSLLCLSSRGGPLIQLDHIRHSCMCQNPLAP